ncbi:MAG: S-methyl-5'-thioadenosine phosphorylase [Myxococcota bacterium]
MKKFKVGIIGGSGLYKIDGLKRVKEVAVRTPFGAPSDKVVTGDLDGVGVVFLPRHGRGHTIPPHQINYRANICAMKMMGVSKLISVAAVGSMKEEIEPGHLIVPGQIFDRSTGRKKTFFEDGVVAHAQFADPFCRELSDLAASCSRGCGATVHEGGTYICIDGPTFSTRAESRIFRSWGVDVVGMTALPEARLAREAELCYATLALATDYDCWHESEANVSLEQILEVMAKNVAQARGILLKLIPAAAGLHDCPCNHAMQGAIITDPARIPAAARRRLAPIAAKYM